MLGNPEANPPIPPGASIPTRRSSSTVATGTPKPAQRLEELGYATVYDTIGGKRDVRDDAGLPIERGGASRTVG